jgi:hypothetical protein
MTARSPLAADEDFVVTGEATGAGAPPKATLRADGRSILHERGVWSEVYDLRTLMSRLRFYKDMSEKTRHPSYREDAKVLGGVAREIKRRAEAAKAPPAAPVAQAEESPTP